MRYYFICLFALLLLGHAPPSNGQQIYQPTWESIDSRPVPGWFQEAKFGIFIHWGVYSVPAYIHINRKGSVYDCYAEWYEVLALTKSGPNRDFHDRVYGKDFPYRSFAPMFKAELWEPDQWAQLFKDAGAKYVILTSKHHDGYCLWPSTSVYSKNWNSVDVGPKRDLVGDLTKAVRDKGLKMGLYFSLMEWESTPTKREGNFNGYYLPDEIISKYKIPADTFITGHSIPQMKELVLKYQPSILYTDGDWDEDYEKLKSLDFLSWLYNNAPNKDEIAVNDRWGGVRGEHGGYYTREYADGETLDNHPWEEIQGMGYSFGLNRSENITDYRTSEELIHLLVTTIGNGGNLCLNVGPAADGTIPGIMQQRLLDIGAWLKINGEAIYSTNAWKNPSDKSPVEIENEKKEKSAEESVAIESNSKIFYTTRNDILYVLTTEWPKNGLVVHGLKAKRPKNVRVSLLGTSEAIKVNFIEGALHILPPLLQADHKLSSAYVFKVTGLERR